MGDIGWAVEELKAGYKVAREGWNGVGIFIEMQRPDENSKMNGSYVYIDTTGLEGDSNDGKFRGKIPWLCSQTDLLAEDWCLA